MRSFLSLLLVLLCFFIPVHFFVIGHGLGIGVAGISYKAVVYHQVVDCLPVTADLEYISLGIYTGRTMLSSIFWIIGSLLIMEATCMWLIHKYKHICLDYYAGMLLIISGFVYIASVMLQYGPLFHGPAGISIPFGIPMIIVLGYAIVKDLFGIESPDS